MWITPKYNSVLNIMCNKDYVNHTSVWEVKSVEGLDIFMEVGNLHS